MNVPEQNLTMFKLVVALHIRTKYISREFKIGRFNDTLHMAYSSASSPCFSHVQYTIHQQQPIALLFVRL